MTFGRVTEAGWPKLKSSSSSFKMVCRDAEPYGTVWNRRDAVLANADP